MKKILSRLVLSLLLLFPVIVNADMGAPETVGYTAVVITEGGIDCYTYSGGEIIKAGHLDNGAKVEISYEVIENNVKYANVENNKSCLYVKITDIVPTVEKISPIHDDVYKLIEPKEYIVSADKVEVRKGPSDSFKIVGTLPVGTKGTYQYYVGSHIYVEVKGIKGWVEQLGKRVLTKTKLITNSDINTECGVIPANTILDDAWAASAWDGETLVRYNACDTYLKTFKSEYIYSFDMYKTVITTKRETKLYADLEKEKEVAVIPAGATAKIIARSTANTVIMSDEDKLPEYAEYNGVQGWLGDLDYNYVTTESNDIPAIPPAQTTVSETNPNDNISDNKPVEDVTSEADVTSNTTEVSETDSITPDSKEEVKKSKTNKMDTRTIIIMSCIAGIAVAAAALVTIVLINKSKKSKTDLPVAPVEVSQESTVALEPKVEPSSEASNEENK